MMKCPKCGSDHVDVQVFQENMGSETHNQSNFKLKEKGHGILWWLFIGWWWMPIKLILWIVAFPFMAVLRLGRKKKYEGTSTGQSTTQNKIEYRRVFLCKDCGHTWNE